MGLRANWGLQSLDSDDPDQGDSSVDPFSKASLAAMNLAAPASSEWMFDVSIETPMEELLRLHGLTMRSNSRLYNEGQDCELRWRSDVSCATCPLSDAENPAAPKCQLCRTSLQEERLETFLVAKSGGV